jgi:hypothetical protein
VPGEIYYDVAYSKDKTCAISEGAVHAGGPCADYARVILNNPDLPVADAADYARVILNNPDLPVADANAYWIDPQGTAHSKDLLTSWLNG